MIVPCPPVYMCAFVSRFVTICRTRAGSASAGGRGSEISTTRRWPFSSTRGCMSAATSSTVVRRSQLRGEISNWPDSIRATSSRSLTRSTSRSVDCSAIWMNSCWRDVRFSFSVDCSSSMKPLIEVSGLRSSCDAVATKSLLACSRRARSVMSRSVHTTPPSGPASRAAVTASATPSCWTVTSPVSAASSAGSGLWALCARSPVCSRATSSPARGFIATTTSCASQMTRPSPRLSIVVARRWRWDSTRAPATARSELMTLNDSPSAASSRGPSASTRTARSPPAIRRVASTSSSSGRRIVRMSSVRNARTATSARPAPSPIAMPAERVRRAASSRAWRRIARWRAVSRSTAPRTAGRRRAALARVDARSGSRASTRDARCAGAIAGASEALTSSLRASARTRSASASSWRAARATNVVVRGDRGRARLASSAIVEVSRLAAAISSADVSDRVFS